MDLEKVFGLGHQVAQSRNPVQHVIRWQGGDLWPEGFYTVDHEVLPMLAVRKEVNPGDLLKRLDDEDVSAFSWAPDVSLCWCDACGSARRVSKTRLDD